MQVSVTLYLIGNKQLYPLYLLTPPNFKVYARRKVPVKRFKICHILYIRKTKVAFSIFHFELLYTFPALMNAFIRGKYKVARNGKSNFGFPYV